MKKRLCILLSLCLISVVSCTSKQDSSQEVLYYSINDNGEILVKDLSNFVFEYDNNNVFKEGQKVIANNATYEIYKNKGDLLYILKITADSGYDLDQLIINGEVIKYTELEATYTNEEGKSYLYNLGNLDGNKLPSFKGRIDKKKTKSLLKKDETLRAYFKDKQYSLIGDSISTFKGYNNNPNYNSTISGNAVYYPYGASVPNQVLTMDDTYWGQMIYDLDMQLCVNNSSSGGYAHCVSSFATQNACEGRCVNLHNDNTNVEPELITVYIGINDHGDYCENRNGKEIGTFTTIDDIKDASGEYKENAGDTFVTGYAMMVDKMKNRYPNAKIYVSNLLPSFYHYNQMDLDDLDTYNEAIKYIAKYFEIGFVDMINDFGADLSNLQDYYEDTLIHPNTKGMSKMAQVFENAIIKDLTYKA